MRFRLFSVCAVTGFAGLLTAAVTGCSAASTAGAAGAAPTTAAASVSAASASPAAVASSASPAAPAALDAQALNSELLPAGDMPKGYTENQSTSLYDNDALPDDSPSPVPAGQLCQVLSQTSWIRAAGTITPDFAEADYGNAAKTEEIWEEIDAFPGADAQQTMTALWQAFGRCATFTSTDDGMTAKVTMSRSTMTGQWTGIKAVQLSSSYQGGETLVAIRVGYAIVTVFDSSDGSDDGSAAIPMAERIASRLKAAEAG